MSRIKTLKRTAQIGYDYLTRWARVSYGRHLNVMLTVEGSADEVLKKLVRPGIPSRLDIATPSESNDE
jgi:phage replication initiation protein